MYISNIEHGMFCQKSGMIPHMGGIIPHIGGMNSHIGGINLHNYRWDELKINYYCSSWYTSKSYKR